MVEKQQKTNAPNRPPRARSTRRRKPVEVPAEAAEEYGSEQRNALLQAATKYVLERGLQDLSLRAIAAEIGTSHRILIYYFKSADGFWQAVEKKIRREEQRRRHEINSGEWSDVEGAILKLWERYTSDAYLPVMRLLFEIYGRAIRKPERFRGFLDDVILSWVTSLEEDLSERYGQSISEIRIRLRLSIAVFRGLQLDLLTTGDRKTTEAALRLFARSLAHQLTPA